MNLQEKTNHLNALQWNWSNCQACMLCQSRTNVVFGYGNPDAQIMIIGEAPGANEDEKGVPFVGNAGQLLDQYLTQVSAQPDLLDEVARGTDAGRVRQLLLREYYFTNIVCCRPPENRDPTPKEIEACRSRLLEIIYTVDPMLIITVGGIAISSLLGKKVAITSARGELFEIEVPGRIVSYKKPVLAVLHTAFLLRQNDFKQPGGFGEKTYHDFLRAHHILDEHLWRNFGFPRPRDANRKCVRCGRVHGTT